MESTMTIKDIFDVLKKNVLIILGIMIVCMGAAFCYFKWFVDPKYEAVSQILITQNAQDQNSAVQNSEIQANIQMVNTYSVVIKSSKILGDAAERLDDGTTMGDLAKKITVDSVQSSLVINIRVTDKDPERAKLLVKTVTTSFLSITPKMMKVNNIEQLTDIYSVASVGASTKVGVALAMMIGLFIGIVISFLRRFLDDRFRTEAEIMKRLDVPVVGVIGNIEDSEFQEKSRYLRRSRK
ncbi:YveK family protein [Listeria booriae]|uniref:Polysaccharide chain length determinant N-terminal domain-containing protein n=1 Tax=Listeria booriae TaxID=1552123 RepID=A0A842EZK9_9LIST|nr:Wzz/FepE/Etk N-terminal domain-containing protein [Listeria booriae]MBC2240553.1 hypothetical protein [Listeria booriae]